MNNKIQDEMVLKLAVLEAIKEEMPINRMDTDEEVAVERLYHRIVARVETVPTSERTVDVDVDSYMKGVRYAIYEIMKEANVYGSNEIRNSGESDDEMCAAAAEKLKEALSQPVEAENILQREMRKRNMTEADILEYMKFEDACALKGFTLKGLLEAGEKKKAKRPYWALDRQGKSTWKNCPCCQQEVTTVNKCCPTCGQKLDWSGLT